MPNDARLVQRVEAFPGLDPCDSLYVSPHPDDAALSCAARILAEAERGESVRLVSMFGAGPEGESASDRLGVPHSGLGFPDAGARAGVRLTAALRSGPPRDETLCSELALALLELVRRTRPKRVYLPLGVWPHPDHLLLHEAAIRVLESGAGRDVFLYEERPFALFPGAVRLRLGELGARLPPGAPFRDRGGLAGLVLRMPADPFLRRQAPGLADRMALIAQVRQRWREAKSWRPHHSFGLRLQPVLQPVSDQAIVRLDEAAAVLPGGSVFGPLKRLTALERAHARRLRAAQPVERYWLLLRGPGADTLRRAGQEIEAVAS
jgi:LmbE family N-acetylglucosaminyl deacetylase